MARYGTLHHRSRSLTLIYDGQFAKIDRDTIKQYLPRLWRHRECYISPSGCLSLDDICPHRSHVQPEAIRLLGQYLREVNQPPQVSAALSHGLEEIWRRSSSAEVKSALVFASLATMFRPKYFGCNVRIFKDMEMFFQRHCAEILEGPPEVTAQFIHGLDRMSKNLKSGTAMNAVLASVVQECPDRNRVLPVLMSLARLGNKSMLTVSTLWKQDRRRREENELRLAHGFGSRSSMHGGELSRRGVIRGDLVPSTVRHHIAMFEPHRMDILGGASSIDYDDDDDDDFLDEESLDSDELLLSEFEDDSWLHDRFGHPLRSSRPHQHLLGHRPHHLLGHRPHHLLGHRPHHLLGHRPHHMIVPPSHERPVRRAVLP